jgi:hypothetical protein
VASPARYGDGAPGGGTNGGRRGSTAAAAVELPDAPVLPRSVRVCRWGVVVW